MKKKFYLLMLGIFVIGSMQSQVTGELTVSVKTSDTGGNYKPKNVVSIWIEDSSGKFVKTLMVYADKRMKHLNTWETSTNATGSMYNKVDAISGATRSNHNTVLNCTWNGKDYAGKLVADGNYLLRMELTDKNNTGRTTSIAFVKDGNAFTQTPANVPSFSNISLKWSPVVDTTPVKVVNESSEYTVFPNPSNGVFTVAGADVLSVDIMNLSGQIIKQTDVNEVDLRNQPKGRYVFIINTKTKTVIKSVICI